MKFGSLISRLFALVVVAPMVGCTHHVTQTTLTTKITRTSQLKIQEVAPVEMPVEKLQLQGLAVELWSGSRNSPPHIIFKSHNDQLLRQEFEQNSEVSFLRPNCERADPNNDALLKLDVKDTYIVVECRSLEDTYKYFVYSATPKVELCDTVNSGTNRLEAIAFRKRVCLGMEVQDQLSSWGARTVCPAVRFVWRWTGHRFQLDSGAMRDQSLNQPTPDLKVAIAEQFIAIPKYSTTGIAQAPPELADEVLSRYYAGQSRSARHFFNECWPKRRRGKERYWRFLFSEAKHGKYWIVAKALNERPGTPRIPEELVPKIEQQSGHVMGPI